jgi:hypothetical protein
MKVKTDFVISQRGQLTCLRSVLVRKTAHAAIRTSPEMWAGSADLLLMIPD